MEVEFESKCRLKAIIRFMNRRFKTKFNYSRIKNYRPIEAAKYLEYKRHITSIIDILHSLLKMLQKCIAERNVIDKKTTSKTGRYKTEGNRSQISEDFLIVIQGFIQEQHICAKRYLPQVKSRGTWE